MAKKQDKPINGPPPIHPGEFLREILEALSMSQAAFASALDVSPMRVSHVLRGERPVTAELALRLGRALGQTPQFWLNLQSDYDLNEATSRLNEGLCSVRRLKPTDSYKA